MKKSEKGFILVPVLGMLVIIITIALSFTTLFGKRHESALNEIDKIHERVKIRNSLGVILSLIKSIESDRILIDQFPKELPLVSDIKCLIEDESGKVNLNMLINDESEQNDDIVKLAEAVLREVKINQDYIDSIIDWIDSDDKARLYGAESEFYNSLGNPYNARNDLMSDISELTLIRGFEKKHLERYFTVSSEGKININSASKEVLKALSPEISSNLAGKIMRYRKLHAFKGIRDILNVDGVTEALYKKIADNITVKGAVFRIIVKSERAGLETGIECYVRKNNKGIKVLVWKEL